MNPGGYLGRHQIVDFETPSGRTYTALKYRNDEQSGPVPGVRFFNFFEDEIDPSTGERNFVQDDGSGSCPDEPTITKCSEIEPGVYAVYARTVYFGDEDSSGGLSCGDSIFEVEKTNPVHFELTDEPVIYALIPDSIPASQPRSSQKVKIKGLNFGATQGSTSLHIGGKTWSADHPKIKVWQDDKIKFKVPKYGPPFPKYKDIWVTVNGKDSNKVQLKITAP